MELWLESFHICGTFSRQALALRIARGTCFVLETAMPADVKSVFELMFLERPIALLPVKS